MLGDERLHHCFDVLNIALHIVQGIAHFQQDLVAQRGELRGKGRIMEQMLQNRAHDLFEGGCIGGEFILHLIRGSELIEHFAQQRFYLLSGVDDGLGLGQGGFDHLGDDDFGVPFEMTQIFDCLGQFGVQGFGQRTGVVIEALGDFLERECGTNGGTAYGNEARRCDQRAGTDQQIGGMQGLVIGIPCHLPFPPKLIKT